MGLAQRTEDVDTHAYWADVNDALMDVCGLAPQDAADAVAKSRQALTYLSEWGRLLAYHDSVPQVAEDIWKQGPGAAVPEERARAVRRELVEWYVHRDTQRGSPHGGRPTLGAATGSTEIDDAGEWGGRETVQAAEHLARGVFRGDGATVSGDSGQANAVSGRSGYDRRSPDVSPLAQPVLGSVG